MKQYSEVLVIGAGASGLLCGSLLAGQGLQVTILEKNNRVGRKLSATGNGRCNFTNLHMNETCYYGEAAWIRQLLAQIEPEEVIRVFRDFGIWHRQKDGYVYPHTNQASTVVELLHRGCLDRQAELVTDCPVKAVERDGDGGFRVQTAKGYIKCRYLILATGGRAGKDSGGDGSGYLLARGLGHSITPLYPGLTGLICDGSFWNRVAGTRIQGQFSIKTDETWIQGEQGEIQIVKNGVSGIPVFQLCRVAAKALAQGCRVEGVIDFVPSMDREETKAWIRQHGVAGLVPGKWIPLVQKAEDPVSYLRGFSFPVRDTFGIDRAQVTAGGIPVSEVNVATLESRVQRNLFVLGELLDIDGKCGGYNLHLAWSTAILAARELTERVKESY